MDGYYVIGVTPIPYPCLGVIINIVSKEDNTYHVTIGDILKAHVQTSPKCQLKLWRKNACVASTCTMCLDFCVRWISRTISSFLLQRTYTTRSCVSSSLPVLLHRSSHVDQGFILVSINVILWQYMISYYCGWIYYDCNIIIKHNIWLLQLSKFYGNRCHLIQCSFRELPRTWVDIHELTPTPVSVGLTIPYRSQVTIHCSQVTTHSSLISYLPLV